MNVLKSLVKNQVRKNYLKKAKKILQELQQNQVPPLAKISAAIFNGIEQNFTEEEKAIISKIENLRQSLNQNHTEIENIDFGAGGASSLRAPEESGKAYKNVSTISKLSQASKSSFSATILFKIVREFQPKQCLELGTCVGISAAYQSYAQVLNGHGKLVTLEGSPNLAKISEKNLIDLGLSNAKVVEGPFSDTLENVLIEHKPIDYAFIDGHHDGEATVRYFNSCLPYLNSNSIVIFDDIYFYESLQKAWHKIKSHEKVKISINLRNMGICILDNSLDKKYDYDIFLMK